MPITYDHSYLYGLLAYLYFFLFDIFMNRDNKPVNKNVTRSSRNISLITGGLVQLKHISECEKR